MGPATESRTLIHKKIKVVLKLLPLFFNLYQKLYFKSVI